MTMKHDFPKKYLTDGFTLIELMVTIAIASIVATIGIPSFNSTITSSRLTTRTNDFVAALHFARSEAVKRNQNVVVNKTGAQWQDGWQVFVDVDNSNAFNAGDEQLKVYGALSNAFTLNDEGDGYISYNSTGATGAETQFILCAKATPEAYTSKLIVINAVGRNSIADDTDSDGIPNQPGGANIASCTP